MTGVYNPKAFILHAASLCQAFAHCKRSSTAASRRSLGSVSVPVWLTILSDQLPVIALVSRYLTNKLIGRGLISKRQVPLPGSPPSVAPTCAKATTLGISPTFAGLTPSWRQITHVFLTLTPLSSQ